MQQIDLYPSVELHQADIDLVVWCELRSSQIQAWLTELEPDSVRLQDVAGVERIRRVLKALAHIRYSSTCLLDLEDTVAGAWYRLAWSPTEGWRFPTLSGTRSRSQLKVPMLGSRRVPEPSLLELRSTVLSHRYGQPLVGDSLRLEILELPLKPVDLLASWIVSTAARDMRLVVEVLDVVLRSVMVRAAGRGRELTITIAPEVAAHWSEYDLSILVETLGLVLPRVLAQPELARLHGQCVELMRCLYYLTSSRLRSSGTLRDTESALFCSEAWASTLVSCTEAKRPPWLDSEAEMAILVGCRGVHISGGDAVATPSRPSRQTIARLRRALRDRYCLWQWNGLKGLHQTLAHLRLPRLAAALLLAVFILVQDEVWRQFLNTQLQAGMLSGTTRSAFLGGVFFVLAVVLLSLEVCSNSPISDLPRANRLIAIAARRALGWIYDGTAGSSDFQQKLARPTRWRARVFVARILRRPTAGLVSLAQLLGPERTRKAWKILVLLGVALAHSFLVCLGAWWLGILPGTKGEGKAAADLEPWDRALVVFAALVLAIVAQLVWEGKQITEPFFRDRD